MRRLHVRAPGVRHGRAVHTDGGNLRNARELALLVGMGGVAAGEAGLRDRAPVALGRSIARTVLSGIDCLVLKNLEKAVEPGGK